MTHQKRVPVPLNESFRKSSFSKPGVHFCVEVRVIGGRVHLRDSKNPTGPELEFSVGEWHAFISGVKNSEFELA